MDWSAVPFSIRANDYKLQKANDMRKLICGLLAIIGLFVAVETKDESENELLYRGIGTATFAVFTFLGGWWDSEKREETPNTGDAENKQPNE